MRLPPLRLPGRDTQLDCELRLGVANVTNRPGLATGEGEGGPPGFCRRGVDVMVELRDLHAALSMQEIRAFLPFSREWLERTLGVSEPDQLFLSEADRDLHLYRASLSSQLFHSYPRCLGRSAGAAELMPGNVSYRSLRHQRILRLGFRKRAIDERRV